MDASWFRNSRKTRGAPLSSGCPRFPIDDGMWAPCRSKQMKKTEESSCGWSASAEAQVKWSKKR